MSEETSIETIVGVPAIVANTPEGLSIVDLVFYATPEDQEANKYTNVHVPMQSFNKASIVPQKFSFVRYNPATQEVGRYEHKNGENVSRDALWNYVDND